MSTNESRVELKIAGETACGGCCNSSDPVAGGGLSRRSFLQGVGAAGVALGSVAFAAEEGRNDSSEPAPGQPFPRGETLRVKPAILSLALHDALPKPNTRPHSWRAYGGIQTPADLQKEMQRLEKDMKELAARSDFPVEFLPIAAVHSLAEAQQVAGGDQDAVLIFGASGYDGGRLSSVIASKSPGIYFVRHRTEPHYAGHTTIGRYILRHDTDASIDPNLDASDVVVDDYGEILWRLRAIYGLKNAKGTKMLAIGGLRHYSRLGQQHAPKHAQDVWGYGVEVVSLEDFGKRLTAARADQKVVDAAEQQTGALLAQPNVTLRTDRKFVFNSFLALRVAKELMKEKGATNFGFSLCMGNPVIGMLDTPPCLVLALANDEGYTAYCHTDLMHTMPGVLLRWISSQPAFVANSHFPHDGIYTVAHCSAPRKMNGKNYEPTDVVTHYESDYGAATKVHYTKGQTVTIVIPAHDCSKWQGFRGKIVDAPSRPACRSQMDIEVDGDWKKLENQVGYHVLVSYGDWLREVGYSLRKLKNGPAWESFSEA